MTKQNVLRIWTILIGAFFFFASNFKLVSASELGLTGAERCDSCNVEVRSLADPTSLVGNWAFTREDNPENALPETDIRNWKLSRSFTTWKKVYGDGKSFRVGWYRAKLNFDPSLIGEEVVFYFNAHMAGVTVYLDGKEVFKRGESGREERSYNTQPIPIRFKVENSSHILALRIDTLLMNGLYQPPLRIQKFESQNFVMSVIHFIYGDLRLIASAIFFAFGIFFLNLSFRTGDRFYVYTGIIPIIFTLYILMPSDLIQRFLPYDQAFLGMYLGAALPYTVVPWFIGLINRRFTFQIKLAFTVVFGFFSLWTLFLIFRFDMEQFSMLLSVMMPSLFVGFIVTSYVVYKAWAAGDFPDAGILLAGSFCSLLSGINDILLISGRVNTVSMSFFGTICVTYTYLVVAARRFSKTFLDNRKLLGEIQKINEGLEQTVAERTSQLREKNKDIGTMLQNLQQGILTVNRDGTVHKEYSAFLEEILDTQDIAGNDAVKLIFSDSNLSSDLLDQMEVSIANFMGEGVFSFEMNEDSLVKEARIRTVSGRDKDLEYSWSAILSEDNDTIEKLLVSIRDVTQMKALSAESQRQKLQLQKVAELIRVKPDAFFGFVASGRKYLHANRELLSDDACAGEGIQTSVAVLFRNMHTIKGNARTLGLAGVAAKAHDAEQKYDQIRKGEQLDFNVSELLKDLESVESELNAYVEVSERILGRSLSEGFEGGTDGRAIRLSVGKAVKLLRELDWNDLVRSQDQVRVALDEIQSIFTVSVSQVFHPLVESVSDLAASLVKPVPHFVLDGSDVRVTSAVSQLIRDVFSHLIRNSLDHGIESASVRTERGKDPTGSIHVSVVDLDEALEIVMKDDGQGLNLERIRSKGVESGVFREGQEYLPEAIAELIFQSGVSTAEKVSDISGRGVGMDAVRTFLLQAGGGILICLDPVSPFAGPGCMSFSWKIRMRKSVQLPL